MISMNVNIQSLHFDADSKLVSYVEKKLSKLNQFHEQNYQSRCVSKTR